MTQTDGISALRTTDQDIEYLRANWTSLAQQYSTNPDAINSTFSELSDLYSSPNRFYHTLHHIAEMIRLIESFKDSLRDSDAVYFAAWFHDAIYDTKASDSEERSAALAMSELTMLSVPPEICQSVTSLILQTKTHDAGRDVSDDAAIFLDADLSILGVSPDIYSQYSNAIRMEYSWVPVALYRNGRKQVLESFLKKERIYLREQMSARFETNARMNLAEEIQLL